MKHLALILFLCAGCSENRSIDEWKHRKWTIDTGWQTYSNATQLVVYGSYLEFKDEQGHWIDLRGDFRATMNK